MPIIVVGGQCSKIGKTAFACALMEAVPGWKWTAIKISPHRHSLGGPSISVEQSASDTTDTGRYLMAGAQRAVLISGDMAEALPRLREEIAAAEMTLIESNSVLEFIQPDALMLVVDPRRSDFKESARRWINRCDALLVRLAAPDDLAPYVPRFLVGPDCWAPAGLITLLKAKLAGF